METSTAALDSDGDIKQMHTQRTAIRATNGMRQLADFSDSFGTKLK
jgi:hypothetical protein